VCGSGELHVVRGEADRVDREFDPGDLGEVRSEVERKKHGATSTRRLRGGLVVCLMVLPMVECEKIDVRGEGDEGYSG